MAKLRAFSWIYQLTEDKEVDIYTDSKYIFN